VLKRFGHIAQQAATDASRREFLGKLGRGAMLAAAMVGGILAFADAAEAGGQSAASSRPPIVDS
jgi:hypothetical protein